MPRFSLLMLSPCCGAFTESLLGVSKREQDRAAEVRWEFMSGAGREVDGFRRRFTLEEDEGQRREDRTFLEKERWGRAKGEGRGEVWWKRWRLR